MASQIDPKVAKLKADLLYAKAFACVVNNDTPRHDEEIKKVAEIQCKLDKTVKDAAQAELSADNSASPRLLD